MDHRIAWDIHAVNAPVWLEDEDYAYVEATVVSVDPIENSEEGAARVTVQTADGQRVTVDTSRPPMTASKAARRRAAPQRKLVLRSTGDKHTTVENMDELVPLNYASILSNVDYRFRLDEIYTRTGPILIALNPFKWLPIYGEDTIKRYKGKPYGDEPPHPYQEAEDAFQNICQASQNQAIVICGESGAGKTETTKLMLQYLATVARRGADGSGTEDLGERLVGSNPLMEAFGNAKTLRNHNSSRFGKFTQLNYDPQFTICGGEISSFLLEKARVVEPSAGERNYHIFYQLLQGAPAELRETFLLQDLDEYRCLSMSGCTSVEGLDDNDEFSNTLESMAAVNISEEERMEILQIVAGVLHLENVEFTPSPDEESCRISQVAALSAAGTCLNVSSAELGDALVKRVRRLPTGQDVVSPQTADQSAASRDALAKAIYSALFDWIVRRINATLTVTGTNAKHFIGILDIFGFEEMPTNSFEQLLINFTNEKLQQLFNLAVFQEEADEYEREQIQWDKTEFPDNNLCIELVERKPMGLIPFMESECSRGAAASDQNLVSKWHKTYVGNPFYGVCGPSTQWKRRDGSRTEATDFVIKHYAGPIIYSVDSFVKKNLDALFPHLANVCAQSSCNIMQSLFPNSAIEDNRAGRATVAGHYLQQLTSLIATLKASDIRFVRCIKTNDDFSPQVVDRPSVLRQCVCSGVMAALAIRRSGFPTRIDYGKFVQEFRVFAAFIGADDKIRTPVDDLQACREMTHRMMTCDTVAARVQPEDYRFGMTKLFLRADVLLTLQQMRNMLILPFVVRIQRWWLQNQEDILGHKLKRAIQFLSDNVNLAERYGVKNVAAVRQAMQEAISAVRYAKGLTMNSTNAFRSALNTALDRNTNFQKAILAAKEKKDEEAKQRAGLLTLVDQGRTRLARIRDGINTIYEEFDIQYLVETVQQAGGAISDCRALLILHANRTAVASQSASPANFASSALQRTFTKAVIELESSGASYEEDVDLDEREKQVAEAIDLVDGAQRIFDDIQQRQYRVSEARATYGNALQQTAELLQDYEAKADELGILGAPTLASVIAHARDTVSTAEAALATTEVDAYEPTTTAAQNAVDRVAAVFDEECNTKGIEDQRAACRLELEDEKKKLEELLASAEEWGIANRQPVQEALLSADEALRAAALLQVGDVGEFEEGVRRAARQVAAFDFVCARQRERKEQNDRFREQEMMRLDQGAETLADLEQRMSLDGLTEAEALVNAVDEANKHLDRARNLLQKSDDVEADRGVVDEVFAHIQNAEQHYIAEKQTRDAARRDASRVQQELLGIETRFNELCGAIEAAGKVVYEVLEPYREAAATDIQDAKRVLRRTEQQGLHPRDCFDNVAAAEASVLVAEEQLDEIRRVLSQTERTRAKESATLAEAEDTLAELQASKIVLKARDGPLKDAVSRAVAECSQARGRLDRPITAAWMYADELAGDLAAVAAALQAVYAAENMAREAERESAVLDRHAKLNRSTLELEASKLAALEAFAADLGLSAVSSVAGALEECHENLNAARRLCTVVEEGGSEGGNLDAEQEAAQGSLKTLAESITNAEKVVAKAKYARDASEKLRAGAAAQIDTLNARLQGLTAALAASGPEVENLCEAPVADAREGLSEATKMLRRGAEATALAPAVGRAESLIQTAEASASKVRRRVAKAVREKALVEAQLASLRETLTVSKDKAGALTKAGPAALVLGGVESGGDGPAPQATASLPPSVEEAMTKAEKALGAAQGKLDAPLTAWLADGGQPMQLVSVATNAVQHLEELVDDAVQRLDVTLRARQRLLATLRSLDERHASVAAATADLSPGPDALLLSEAMAAADTELASLRSLAAALSVDAASAAASRGHARVISAAEESVRAEEAALASEQQRQRLKDVEVSDARQCLPVLQRQLASVDAQVEASGAALVGHLCHTELANGRAALHELERFVTFEGVGQYSRNGGPRLVEAAFSAVTAADHAAKSAMLQVSKVTAQKAADLKRLAVLDAHFRSIGERLAEMCNWSDPLRIQLEADWGEKNWFGSQSKFASQDGSPGGRNEISSQGTVVLLRDAVQAAEGALNTARRRVEGSVSQWLEAGPLVVRRAIEDAILKTAALEEIVDGEYAKLQRENAQRRSAQEALEAQVTRYGTAQALAEDAEILGAPGVRVMLQGAENAINVVTELLGTGAVSAAAPALDECIYKVSSACEHVHNEVDRADRRRAEAQACLASFAGLRRRLEHLREKARLADCGGDAEVELCLGRAEAALTAGAQLATQKLTHSSAALSRSLATSTMAVEAAERAVSRAVARKEEVARLQQRRQFLMRVQAAKDEQMFAQQLQREQLQRNQLRASAAKAQELLASRAPTMDLLAAKMRASEDALSLAQNAVDSASVAAASNALVKALRELQGLDFATAVMNDAPLAARLDPEVAGAPDVPAPTAFLDVRGTSAGLGFEARTRALADKVGFGLDVAFSEAPGQNLAAAPAPSRLPSMGSLSAPAPAPSSTAGVDGSVVATSAMGSPSNVEWTLVDTGGISPEHGQLSKSHFPDEVERTGEAPDAQLEKAPLAPAEAALAPEPMKKVHSVEMAAMDDTASIEGDPILATGVPEAPEAVDAPAVTDAAPVALED